MTLSGTVTDGSGHGWPLYTRIEIDGRPGGPIFTNPVTGQYSVSIPANATYSIKYTATLPGYQVVTDSVVVGGSNTVHNVAIPIQANCTAPGYQFNFSPALTQDFNSGSAARVDGHRRDRKRPDLDVQRPRQSRKPDRRQRRLRDHRQRPLRPRPDSGHLAGHADR